MSKEAMVQIFDDMGGDVYDKNNSLFFPVHQNLQFLMQLILKDLPHNARILCVGVGTGADIIDLAKANQEWTFVGLDPAASMLKKCDEKLQFEGLGERCQLYHGYLGDYKETERFDAVLCLYVMHFIKDMNERAQMYRDMAKYTKAGGRLITAEICVDLKSHDYPSLLENWKTMHGLAGAPKEKLAGMSSVIEEQLAVLSPQQTQAMISESGFENPASFFRSFLITGHWAQRGA